MTFDLAVSNGIIVTPDRNYVPFVGSIGICDGLIEYVGERKIFSQETKELINAEDRVVMPGLINGHCHAEMSFARGLGDELTLFEQNQLFSEVEWFRCDTTEEDRHYSRLLTFIEAVLSGTTFILDNTFWDMGEKPVDALTVVGIRGGIVNDYCSDFSDPENFKPLINLIEHRDHCTRKGVIPVFGNLLEEGFTPKGLERVKELSDQLNSLITGHLCETEWRKEIIQARFQKSAVEVLAEYRILNPQYIGSHAINLSDEDIRILSEQDVKVVNTPICEMKIADGIAPIRKMLDAGITVGLGSDGAMWNNVNDIFSEMKCMILLHTLTSGIRTISPRDVLDMATIGGARVFGLAEKIGSLEVGKLADLILINIAQPHIAPIRLRNSENISSSIVYCVSGRDVTDVVIGGRQIVRKHRLLTIDVEDVMHRVTSISEKIGSAHKEVVTRKGKMIMMLENRKNR